ncbi:MAG: hypothetical protein MUC50_15295 [Myxococcota bacterium]|nr:hypothetical protein [Myxococcota bacterium]
MRLLIPEVLGIGWLGALFLGLACAPGEPATKGSSKATIQNHSTNDETGDPPSQLWTGGAFPCSEMITEIQVTQITSGPSDDKRYVGQTALKMELVRDAQRIQAICAALGEKMSRNEVLCPPEFLEAHQAELRTTGGKVVATAVRARRFVDTKGKEQEQNVSMWLTVWPRPVCYELSPADPMALDTLLRAVFP